MTCVIYGESEIKTFIHIHGHDHPYTASQLDMILCNNTFEARCRNVDLINVYFCDHKYIQATFDLQNLPRGAGYWKFNAKLLLDKPFVNAVSDLIKKSTALVEEVDIYVVWEQLKYDVQLTAKNTVKIRPL